MRLLDLYCGAGLAAIGYSEAGFEVVGVDIRPQPNYPFRFIQRDALSVLADRDFLRSFDAIHASPPCQAFSVSTAEQRATGKVYPNLVPATRAGLERSNRPFVIENVPGAPIRPDIVLRGDLMGLKVLKKRWFELGGGFWAMSPRLLPKPTWSVEDGDYVSIFGRGSYRKWKHLPSGWRPSFDKGSILATWHFAMGLPDWFRPRDVEMSEGIPPAYTRYIGGLLAAHIRGNHAAAAAPAGSGADDLPF